jgi:hypothetical protein
MSEASGSHSSAIRAEIRAGRESWLEGLDTQLDTVTANDINKYFGFKILKYEVEDVKDKDM